MQAHVENQTRSWEGNARQVKASMEVEDKDSAVVYSETAVDKK